ncbi:hypothetical protein ACGC1H_006062 [Rhizoctonia solani]
MFPDFVGDADGHGNFDELSTENYEWWSAFMDDFFSPNYSNSNFELGSSELMQPSMVKVGYEPATGLEHQPTTWPSSRPHRPLKHWPGLPRPIDNEYHHQDSKSHAQSGSPYIFPKPYSGSSPQSAFASPSQQRIATRHSTGLPMFARSSTKAAPRPRGYTPPLAPGLRFRSEPLSPLTLPLEPNPLPHTPDPSTSQVSTGKRSNDASLPRTNRCSYQFEVGTNHPEYSAIWENNPIKGQEDSSSLCHLRLWSDPSPTIGLGSTLPSQHSINMVLPNVMTAQIIGHTTPLVTIIEYLANHGCPDVTSNIRNVEEHSRYSGSLSDVYQGRWADGNLVAVKCLRALSNSDTPPGKLLKHTARELYTWSRASHPNILELYGLAMVRGKLAMIAPWMDYGSLLAYIRARPRVDRCNLCAQIAAGLLYMHNLGLVHGDIKGTNVVVSEDGTAKLTDFGSATMAREFAIAFTATQTVNYSIRWAAPELFQSQCPRFESDVYAFAKTVLEALTGDIPHKGLNDFAIMRSVGVEGKLPDRPRQIPLGSKQGNKLWDMLSRCWHLEPEQRPLINEVYELMNEMTQDELQY